MTPGIDVAAMEVESVYGHAPRTTILETKDFREETHCDSGIVDEGGGGGVVSGFSFSEVIRRTAPTGQVRGVADSFTVVGWGRNRISEVGI